MSFVSIEAEQSVLGGLLLDNGAIDRIASLKPEHFADGTHRKIFATLQAELLAGRAVDVMTLFERLRAGGWGDMAYLNGLAQAVPSATNIARYASTVIDRSKARTLAEIGTRAREIAEDASRPIDERIDAVQAEIGRLSDSVAQREAVSLFELVTQHTATIEKRGEGHIDAIPTGLTDIDEALAGGYRRGTLNLVAARPSQGKTAFALTAAMHAAATHGVGVLSMEMSADEIADRSISLVGRAKLADIQRPMKASPEFWERVVDGVERSRSLSLWIDDQGNLTLHQAAAKARAMKRKHSIDMLVVDYLQLMAGSDSKLSRTYQLEEITRGFKALAKTLNIAVVALAQVNRSVGNEMPGLADLKDSGALEQDADTVTFLHRPIAGDPSLPPEWKHYARARIAKNRQGPTTDVNLGFMGEHTLFTGWSGEAPRKPSKRQGGFDG